MHTARSLHSAHCPFTLDFTGTRYPVHRLPNNAEIGRQQYDAENVLLCGTFSGRVLRMSETNTIEFF